MISFLKSLPLRAAHAILAQLARSAKGRKFIARLISDAQEYLGIGAGVDVNSSGEQAIFVPLLEAAKTLSRPLCIFDVGSNQGQFLQLADRCLAEAPHQTHCFEPSPTTFDILSRNAGNRSDVVLNPFGLGKAAGEYALFSDTVGSGLASLSKRRLDHFGIDFERQEMVQIQTVDAYCERHDIPHIDLLKLDVEGHELDVLSGSERMFAEGRISVVTFEFGGTHIDARTFFQDFYYFFRSHGMSAIYRILPSGGLDKIDAYTESLEQFRTANFLVFRD